MDAEARNLPQSTLTRAAYCLACVLVASCGRFVAGQDELGDGEASVDGSPVAADVQADLEADAPPTDSVTPSSGRPSFRMILTSVDDGSPTGRATLFAAATGSPTPNAPDPGSERVVEGCVVRRHVNWVEQDIGQLRIEFVWGVTTAQFSAGLLNYGALLAERTLPADSLVTVVVPAGGGFSATRLSVAEPASIAPIYPSAMDLRAAAPLDLTLPIRWQPVESRFSLLVFLKQTRGTARVSVMCRVPTTLGTYTLPPEVIAAVDRNIGKTFIVGLSDLTEGTVRGVHTRFYSLRMVASISDSP